MLSFALNPLLYTIVVCMVTGLVTIVAGIVSEVKAKRRAAEMKKIKAQRLIDDFKAYYAYPFTAQISQSQGKPQVTKEDDMGRMVYKSFGNWNSNEWNWASSKSVLEKLYDPTEPPVQAIDWEKITINDAYDITQYIRELHELVKDLQDQIDELVKD